MGFLLAQYWSEPDSGPSTNAWVKKALNTCARDVPHTFETAVRPMWMRPLLLAIALIATGSAALAQTCKSFSNCEEAVESLRSGNSRLDRDKDGVPCESLCGKNGENMR